MIKKTFLNGLQEFAEFSLQSHLNSLARLRQENFSLLSKQPRDPNHEAKEGIIGGQGQQLQGGSTAKFALIGGVLINKS